VLLQKIVYAGANAHFFAEGAEHLEKLAEVVIPVK
jgi:hypothetical protein